MTSWKTYKLGDVVNILDNRRIPLSARQREQRRGEYPYYGAQGIIDYVDDYLFDGTYLLIAEDGENLRSKKQNIAQLVSGKYWVNNHAHILESNGLCDIRYICYLLNIIDITGYITGSAQPKLNQSNLLAISISLPSLEEQRRIAGILGAIDDKIENNRRINDNLEQQAQALYKQWFVDFEFPNEEGKPYKSSGGKMVDSELGPIPEGWRVGLLKDIVNFQSGFPFKSELFSERGTYRLITIKGVQDGYLDANGAVYIKNIPDRMPLYCLLTEGDIIMSLTGNVGRCCIVDRENLLLNQRVVKLQPTFINSNMFIYTMFRRESFKEKLIALAKGTAQANLSPIETANMRTITPSASCLVRFNKLGQSIFKQLLKNIKENNRLAALRDTLLPKLMSGEIKL